MAEKRENKDLQGKQYVIFQLHDEFYGVDVVQIESIERISQFTRVPQAGSYVLGVMNLRGDVVPVLDIRGLMGLETISVYDESTRVIIAHPTDYQIGFIVDSVTEVGTIPDRHIQNDAALFNEKGREYITGVAEIDGRYVMILNLMLLLG